MLRYTFILLALLFITNVSQSADVDYVKHVKPLLAARCGACHGALAQKAKLRLDAAQFIRAGGRSGPAIVPNKSGESLLIQAVIGKERQLMPPATDGVALNAEEIQLLKSWIDAGAKLPEKEAVPEDPKKHWAFVAPQKAEIRGQKSEIKNPIDHFVHAQLKAEGISPRPLADKLTMLRRVTLDLIGLPPTREQMQEFLADDSPNAFEKVVDRLLASPQYGERWGRHWMDVWRYADWHGRRQVPDVWNSASQIWRWRDWIVRSLNDDHGYDRMVQEMLAADEIRPADYEAGVATGYLIRNWYALNPNDWMRNTVEHTGKAFLGLTFNCAHCHDHKYDPILQDDYFRLRAFFEPMGVRQDRVPGQADPGVFQEYEYSTLRRIQRLGAVRIFDKSPEAPTWFYTGGDERNRVKDRGSMAPGVPGFLSSVPLKIEPQTLPTDAWYPGNRAELRAAIRAVARTNLANAEEAFAAFQKKPADASEELQEKLKTAEAEYAEVEKTSKPGALEGKQSLLIDSTAGRRIVQNTLPNLKALPDGTVFEFRVQLLTDTHFNFQFAKDHVKGLTSGYVGFEKGRVLSYQPGTMTEFEVGRYDHKGGQQMFHVELSFDRKMDKCLLSVRSLSDDKILVDKRPVALNGWNPIGDATKAITFDVRTGSVVVLDAIKLVAPGEKEPLAAFDFESPKYPTGKDIVGQHGWVSSFLSTAAGTSTVSATALNSTLREAAKKLEAAKRAARVPMLPRLVAEAKLLAARADVASIEARITADEIRTMNKSDAVKFLEASTREREANIRKAEAELLAKELALVEAEKKPTSDMARAKAIDTATKAMTTAKAELGKAEAIQPSEKYTPFSPQYPKTSTGRRKALAEWVTHRQNPLTARVAVNHIWMRHFHSPLVSSVYDFGRNGTRPTHPELLDWLAVEFMESGWSMKKLHRLIVTSETYRRVSSVGDANVSRDPENRLLSRMNTGRMEAEVVRDSVLFCSGKLDGTMGGQELENTESLTTHRRSLYYATFPEGGGKSPIGELFDGPEALECYRRSRSVLPQQALALTNSDFVHGMSAAVLEKLKTESDEQKFIEAAFEKILSRPPSEKELAACREYLKDNSTRTRESLVRVLFNHNDFITIR